MRVAIHKGRIIEAQGNDRAPLDALIRNAVSAGLNPDEMEFTVLPDAEVMKRIEEQNAEIPKPLSRLDDIEARLSALERK